MVNLWVQPCIKSLTYTVGVMALKIAELKKKKNFGD